MSSTRSVCVVFLLVVLGAAPCVALGQPRLLLAQTTAGLTRTLVSH